MGLEKKVKEALELVELKKLDLDIAKDACLKARCNHQSQTKKMKV